MKKSTKRAGVGVGVGVAALAAAAAAAYFLYGPNGKKNRANVKRWSGEAKREVVKALRRLKTVNRAVYERTVETVAKKYQALKDISPAEVRALVKELKGHWQDVSRAAAGAVKKVAKKKPAGKTSKKTSRK